MPKLLTLALVLTLTLAAGCGEAQRQSPDTAVEDFIHLINSRDFGPAYDSLAEDSPWRSSSRNEFITEMTKMYGGSPMSYRISEFRATAVVMEPNGEAATVDWSAVEALGLKGEKGGSITNSASVVREDGVWRVVRAWGE